MKIIYKEDLMGSAFKGSKRREQELITTNHLITKNTEISKLLPLLTYLLCLWEVKNTRN